MKHEGSFFQSHEETSVEPKMDMARKKLNVFIKRYGGVLAALGTTGCMFSDPVGISAERFSIFMDKRTKTAEMIDSKDGNIIGKEAIIPEVAEKLTQREIIQTPHTVVALEFYGASNAIVLRIILKNGQPYFPDHTHFGIHSYIIQDNKIKKLDVAINLLSSSLIVNTKKDNDEIDYLFSSKTNADVIITEEEGSSMWEHRRRSDFFIGERGNWNDFGEILQIAPLHKDAAPQRYGEFFNPDVTGWMQWRTDSKSIRRIPQWKKDPFYSRYS